MKLDLRILFNQVYIDKQINENVRPKKSIYGRFKLKKILLLNSPFHYFIKT